MSWPSRKGLKFTSKKTQFGLNISMSLKKTMESIRFYDYSIDRLRWVIQWQEQPIVLGRKSFDLLLYLIDHRDRVVSKNELLEQLWPEQFIEESNLTQHIFLLRKALSKHEGDQKIIQTLPGRGYRFTAPLVESDPLTPEVILSATESITRITVEEEEDSVPSSSLGQISSASSAASRSKYIALIAAAVLIALSLGGWLGWKHYMDRSGGLPVQVILTPMEGTTGDAVLDTSLVQALRMELGQSPYVSIVPSTTVRATLTAMRHKPDDPMTEPMAREICERTNSQAVVTGRIARAGQHFLITEEATNCVDGAVLGEAEYDAAKLEELPYAMGKLAANMRQKLGESRRSIARFNTLLFQQNTASLDALKAFTQGTQKIYEGKFTDSIALLKNAVAADPQFAPAYYNLAAVYSSVGDDLHAREAIQRAYELRDRATRSNQFGIDIMYSSEFTGDQYELLRLYRSWADLYPNSSQAWSGLANAQRDLGMDAESLISSQRTVQLLPHSQGMLANLAMEQMRNNDPHAALATCERAIANNLDGDGIRFRFLQVAYLLKDPKLLEMQRAWEESHPQAATVLIVENQIATAEGRFNDSHRMIERIRDMYHQQGLVGPDDEKTKFAAVELMQIGDLEAGKELFQQAPVDIEDGQEVLGLAYVGDFAAARSALHANEVKYPRATPWNLFWGPRIKAAIAMAEHRPAEAAAMLETARPFDTGGRYLPWLRGNAYLAAGQPALAEKDYRSVVTHPEFDPTSPYISLSWLGLARSLKAQGNRSAAIDAYRHFLGLWAHADSDAKLLIQAKLELSSIQQTPSVAAINVSTKLPSESNR
jgi:DNA-binding winged helix-turn-helix (wHTH) protein/tetratricopeptide (TPR) repeat protein